jgi:hypothetical protein
MPRNRITLGLAIAVAVLGQAAMIPWIAVLATVLSVFLILWGRDSQRTEAAIGGLPGVGPFLLRALHQLDRILSPPDKELEQHLREVISTYTPEHRAQLYRL